MYSVVGEVVFIRGIREERRAGGALCGPGRERLKSSCRRQKMGAGRWGGGGRAGRVSSMISCIFKSKLFLYSFVYCLYQVDA